MLNILLILVIVVTGVAIIKLLWPIVKLLRPQKPDNESNGSENQTEVPKTEMPGQKVFDCKGKIEYPDRPHSGGKGTSVGPIAGPRSPP